MKKAVPIGLGFIGVALAEVYVVDPSIDQYKQKTDQTFYDTYQNPQSIIARAMQRKNPFNFNALSTDQRLTSTRLDTLPLITDVNSSTGMGLGIVGGSQRRTCSVSHPSGRWVFYMYRVDDDGNPVWEVLRAGGSYQYTYGFGRYNLWRHSFTPTATRVGIGWDAGGVRCVSYCDGQCVRERKSVKKLLLDTTCRTASLYRTEYERSRSCWRCGKSTCYGSWSSWSEVAEGQIEDSISLTSGVAVNKGAVLYGWAHAYKLY